jgi:hypothetical protein
MSLRTFLQVLVLSVGVIALSPATAQVSFGIEGPNAEFHRLFERISRSEFVTPGKVIERKPVWRRGVSKVVQVGPNQYASQRIEEITGGYDIEVEVSGAICKQQDFVAIAAGKKDVPSRVHVFVPYEQERESDLYPGMHVPQEALFAGREYLLFLAPWPRQAELQAKFELDPNVTYYRVVEGRLGAEELSDAPSRGTTADRTAPLVSALTSLCGAVSGGDASQKLARLRSLQKNADPRWKDSVEATIRVFEAQK